MGRNSRNHRSYYRYVKKRNPSAERKKAIQKGDIYTGAMAKPKLQKGGIVSKEVAKQLFHSHDQELPKVLVKIGDKWVLS